MTDLYDQRIDEMKARERRRYLPYSYQNISYNTERLAAYKRKRADLQRLGQEYDNG